MAALKASEIYRDERQAVILVVSVELCHEKCAGALCVYAKSEPVAIVIAIGSRTYAVDVNAEPADLDLLLQNTEGLVALLGR